MWRETKEQQAEQFSVDTGSSMSDSEWAEWPDPDVELDDDAFAAAIARGRELEAAA